MDLNVTDLNIVVLCGRLVAPPEIRVFESGASLVRYLVTLRSEEPNRRVDVVPVTMWEPTAETLAVDPRPGQRLWFSGSVQRRFWTAEDGRRSRIEVIATHMQLHEDDAPVGFVSEREDAADH